MIYWEYARCKHIKMELKFHIFRKIQNILKKSIFEHFFRTRKSKNSVFRGSAAQLEILEKIAKNRKSVRGGRVSWENHPKHFFRSSAGPCGQNESYTNFVRPFPKKLLFGEVSSFLVNFPEIPFWSMCGYVISPMKNY